MSWTEAMVIPDLPKGFSHPVRIGEGAFGSVYRAHQWALDRHVAIKIIHESDSKKRKELLNEAKIQASIALKCIPQVYDAFERKKCVYIIMQWIKGVSLKTLLENKLLAQDRFQLAQKVLLSLSELHALSFAHRDLKPSNILIASTGECYLIDFGFSKEVKGLQNSTFNKTQGTPAYMAPEVWLRGEGVDHIRADVYSAGKIVSEILEHDDSYTNSLSPLLEENPEKRLRSAKEALECFSEINSVSVDNHYTWPQTVQTLSNQNFSHCLMLAAKQLMYTARFDEAYLLVVECLEIDPENTEALKIINSFSGSKKKHILKRRVSLTGAFLTLIALLLLSFFAGKQSVKHESVSIDKEKERISLGETYSQKVTSIRERMPFRSDPVRVSKSLTSVLYVNNLEDWNRVTVNQTTVNKEKLLSGLKLEQGSHLVRIFNKTDTMIWEKQVTLLPFQNKTVRVPSSIQVQQ
ncbi:serine/threonine-protein kinase [Chitinispirillales bacterium ANBcel5]|uniref:serine/threonine-protein kinase n=1 Tax=Cellulosispirillum alkaliphilum TaxID=3039283 RepID=UPI002A573F45|nr:serine/threonine-protein kinase [Chitinispirillales bacterium ANBcel5]